MNQPAEIPAINFRPALRFQQLIDKTDNKNS